MGQIANIFFCISLNTNKFLTLLLIFWDMWKVSVLWGQMQRKVFLSILLIFNNKKHSTIFFTIRDIYKWEVISRIVQLIPKIKWLYNLFSLKKTYFAINVVLCLLLVLISFHFLCGHSSSVFCYFFCYSMTCGAVWCKWHSDVAFIS